MKHVQEEMVTAGVKKFAGQGVKDGTRSTPPSEVLLVWQGSIKGDVRVKHSRRSRCNLDEA